jgi:tetratricopeptide (TPR) repeat protein
MKPLSCAGVVLCLWAGAVSAQTAVTQVSVYQLFARGNQLYEAGDFEEAVDVYQESVDRGASSPELFYNLANAYYKSGDLGRTVLNYERSLRLAPRDEDARANISLVRSMLRDRQFVDEPGAFKRTVTWLDRRLNLRESLLVTSLLYLALMIVAIVFVFRDTSIVSRIYPKISLGSPGRFLGLDKPRDFALAMTTLSLLLTFSGVSSWNKYHDTTARRAAIVVRQEAAVYGGPSTESTLQFKVHEGTRVSTGETRPGWIQIHLPGDLSGWIVDRWIERI